ncbi:MAG: tRNA (N(6)-L-threonylcarbamoyladenosine(37)-C(2))-methylthiotransferase MtaB [Bacteroidales bacterium]|nr:tRNA (N(6)-L-threonylcarbamoyladenosine(37)-C(2))-methylthiotransferase MtaB [Bacteroidales bacterium]
MNTVAIHTLGCKLNFSESSDLARRFVEHGFRVVDFKQKADVYIINTCTVTALAEKKCRTIIRQAVSLNPDAIVAAIGCFAQNNSKEIETIEGVDFILGNNDKHKLLDYILESSCGSALHKKVLPMGENDVFVPTYSTGDRTRSFFKVQDGCNYFCTYCAIPFARGRNRSMNVADTVAKAKEITNYGMKEVVITGINTGEFGKLHGETFFDLIKELDKIEPILRYRISSIEPNLITDDMIDFIAQSRAFLPHFHIPLQAGSDTVLSLMNRRYDTKLYAERLEKIKSVMPHACIACDIIAGFTGETDELFDEACHFINSIPISYLHVFTYSERPNTKSLSHSGKVPVSKRRERSKILHQISEAKKLEFYKQNEGTTRSVLWESDVHGGYMFGFTDNYIKVRTPYSEKLVNEVTPVVLTDLNVGADDVYDCEIK